MTHTEFRRLKLCGFPRINKRCGILSLLVMLVISFGLFNVMLLNKEKGGTVFKHPHLKSQPTTGTRTPDACPDSIKRMPSFAKPPYYPTQGTGAFVNVSATFDTSKFSRFCETSPSLTAILPVYSAVDNFNRRVAIRSTIGRECQKLNCKVMFIIGYSPTFSLMQKLRTEYKSYQDILIVDHVDTYRDLNNKAVAMLDWLLEFCTGPKYVIHFIDDAFINIGHYLEDLETVGLSVYGYIIKKSTTEFIHAKSRKFHVSPKEYPYWITPDFVIGNAYAFPNTIITSLRCAVPKAIYIWLEDVWLMGHVRELAGIRAMSTKRSVQCWPNKHGHIDYDNVHAYLFIHPVSVDEMYKLHDSKRQTSNWRIR